MIEYWEWLAMVWLGEGVTGHVVSQWRLDSWEEVKERVPCDYNSQDGSV